MSPRTETRARARLIVGWVLVVVGVVALLWSVFQVSSAGFGTSPVGSFAQRRSYDRVKREVHEVFPEALMRALLGLSLVAGGRYLIVHRVE